MSKISGAVLKWARETAGLDLDQAAIKLGLGNARGLTGPQRLSKIEAGEEEPSRGLLGKMSASYRRSLLTLYLEAPPKKGDRGEDFRTLPGERSKTLDALVDALLRDIRVRQSVIKSILEEEESPPLKFVTSAKMDSGASAVAKSIQETLGVTRQQFRKESSIEDAFGLLRTSTESAGIFVALMGNLGSHHTTIDVEHFRGFAIADKLAPFVVINDQDAKGAWSFTLIHELAHIWLGQTGVSGARADKKVEKFCNEVAAEFLLPSSELKDFKLKNKEIQAASNQISNFASARNLSATMVAYNLYLANKIDEKTWTEVAAIYRAQWLKFRESQRQKDAESDGGPNYYIVRRHRLGRAILDFVSRTISDGGMSLSEAGRVLGVKPRNISPLLDQSRVAKAS
jgi:Zn-dependent peptidase ImmA (M78 family)/transcriptional regulator with XRE-family HTH domain